MQAQAECHGLLATLGGYSDASAQFFWKGSDTNILLQIAILLQMLLQVTAYAMPVRFCV